jgi:hypothetical protein
MTMKRSLACLTLALSLTLMAPLAASAAPTCPQTPEVPLSEVPAGLKPGTWIPADALGTYGRPENPLATFKPAFQDHLTVAREQLEIRGFVESADPGGRAAVVLLKPAAEGFCVLNAWMSSASERFSRLVLVSMWRSKDSQRAVLLVEASQPHSGGSPASACAVVLGTNAQHVWKAFDAHSTGMAFDPQPGTVALLGAGTPLFLDDSGQFRARPLPKNAVAAEGTPPTCPKSGNKPLGPLESDPLGEDSKLKNDQWVPTDAASQLYELWDSDSLAQVAFRKLLTVGGREVEAVGLTGSDATVVFLARASKGFCVLSSRYWAFGGNGVHASSSWWRSKDQKLAVLLLSLTLEYHHGAGSDDPRSEDGGVALTLDGLRVRLASAKERASAQASQPAR